jgi:major membrane immunogen (membrane-anchored lipoprotein)
MSSAQNHSSAIRISQLFILWISISMLLVSCGGSAPDPGDLVMQYYNAIENDDSDAAAALFSDAATIVTPSGNTVSGDAIKSQFIRYDLQFMDRVEFLSEFSQSNGKVTWTQEYHQIEGNSFLTDCEIKVEDGKIVEWLFQ